MHMLGTTKQKTTYQSRKNFHFLNKSLRESCCKPQVITSGLFGVSHIFRIEDRGREDLQVRQIHVSRSSAAGNSAVRCCLGQQRTTVRQREQEHHANKQQPDLLLKTYMEQSTGAGCNSFKFCALEGDKFGY